METRKKKSAKMKRMEAGNNFEIYRNVKKLLSITRIMIIDCHTRRNIYYLMFQESSFASTEEADFTF